MDYSFERRRRRRKHRSSASYDRISSRDEDDLEQDIIDRAMEIERNRERSLRRQLEYIVHNVKELERRRQERHRAHSSEYYPRSSISPSRHRSFARHSYRNSSSERYYQTNDSSHSEKRRSSKSTKFESSQITMIYQGQGNERHGDEIMVLQENIIVFKGFLQPEEPFTFKFEQHHRQSNVNLEFFINEIFECSLAIDCERQQIEQENPLFQLQNIQSSRSNRRDEVNGEQQRSNGTTKSKHSRKHHRSHTSSSSPTNEERRSTEDQSRHQQKSKSSSNDQRTTVRDNSHSKQRSQRSPPSPPQLPPKQRSAEPKTNSTQAPSSVSRQSSSKPTDKKPSKLPLASSDNDDDQKTSKQSTTAKPSYGPPQLSTFARSSSESSADELATAAKGQSEKPSTEIARASESPPPKKDDNEEEEESGEGGGLSGFLQLLQAMPGRTVRTQQSGDDGDGIQGLLTRLGIVTQTNVRKKAANATPRQVGNVENFLFVYLDSSTPDESLVIKFRGLVNFVKLFDDADDCIAFINSISNEKVILFVSDALGDPVVSRIQDLQQLFAIYVFCESEEQADGWSTNQPKIRGISADIDHLLDQIKDDIANDEGNLLTFAYSLPNANTKEEPAFVINQIIKEILVDPDETTDAKKELVDFARIEYENNDEQLKSIQQFEENYQKENVLEFFEKNQFLYKMMNKAFRIPEVDVLFKLRLFIQNLHRLIISSSTDSSVNTLYRSQFVTSEELDTLRKCTDGTLLAFSHFFLASTERPELNISTTENVNEHQDKGEEIVFQIDVSNSNQYMTMENQILVSFGLVSRVGNIEKDKNGRTIIHLTTVNNDDRQLERFIEPIRKETRAPHPSLRLVKLFIELDQYSQAVQLGQVLITDLPHARKDPLLALARTYHSLGTTLYEKEEYDQALDVIKKSHELYLRFLPEDAPQLSPTWNNMGSIYLRQGKTDLALEYHEKALAIQLKSPSPDLPSIISYSNNIGGVYLKLERYDEALVHFKRALQIEEQTLPANHPELAGTYHRIGGVYFRQNNYEQALEYYDKTLEIELASLPDTHPTVAVTYHNRGTAFEGLGKLEEAVESAEKAVERLLKTLPKEHPQVRMNQAYVDKLKQKLWVKQLFTS